MVKETTLRKTFWLYRQPEKREKLTKPRKNLNHHKAKPKKQFTQRIPLPRTTEVMVSPGHILKNVFPFAIPRREMHRCRGWKRQMCWRSSSPSVFVSPLEPCLPREPFRPGNKQAFVNTDPLCLAARQQTSPPMLMENIDTESTAAQGWRVSGFYCIHLHFDYRPSKQGQADRVLTAAMWYRQTANSKCIFFLLIIFSFTGIHIPQCSTMYTL